MKKKYYDKGNLKAWTGRTDSERPERVHQLIGVIDLDDMPNTLNGNRSLLGFACDEGVRRNKGRVGAAEAPAAIRKAMGSLSYREDQVLYDAGNILCPGEKLEKAQNQLAKGVTKLLETGLRPVILGGGHETAYGTYNGLRRFLSKDQTIGIINLDAHFDIRDDSEGASSGTPFYQVYQECAAAGRSFYYLVLGIDQAANTSTLFERAGEWQIDYLTQDIGHRHDGAEQFLEAVKRLEAKVDAIYLTIDMDVFSAAVAPGVSAVNPLGLMPGTVLPVIDYLDRSPKLKVTDICELNPTYDQGSRTARLAGRLVHRLV